jgi:predicted ATPase
VHALRKRLGAERIATEGPGYRLRVERGELDLEQFERLVAQGRSALGSGATEEAASLLREALGLWRGPALADVAYEPFAQSELARIEELRLVALEERVEADLALGRQLELVPELEALVAEHPLRERLHGQLMLALYRSGRQTDALAAFRDVRRTLRDELGLEPGPELQELQQAILRQDAALRVEPPELRARRHLPAPLTPLVGRRRELDSIGTLLRSGDVRLITLTGAGGSGKTRLGLQIAHDLADVFPDGVYFVDLSHLREAALVPTTIAHALGLEERGDEQVAETLQRYLRRRRLLLLLDNFEVVDEAAPVLADLLQAAAELSLLVTSRTPLRLLGEHEHRVAPLPLGEAVQLFAARARAVAPSFRRASEEAAEVSEICRRVDCLPLAIELAAARTREYSPAEMLGLLPSALELAGAGARDLPERQRTLRAAIDWSHELLADDTRALFACLAVFAGGCTAAAAEAICDAKRSALASLASSSLLQERLGSDGQPRFFMLETVREYAAEALEATGEADAVRRRHAQYYTEFAEASEREQRAPETWMRSLDDELDNLRAALVWCNAAGEVELELRIVGALPRFWFARGHMREARGRADAALRHSEHAPAPLRAKALLSAARAEQGLASYERMRELAEQSLAVYRSIGDAQGAAWALDRLATAVTDMGDLERGASLYLESASMFRALEDRLGIAVTLNNLSCVYLMQDEPELAAAASDESLALCRALGRRWGMVLPLSNLALAALERDRLAEAFDFLREGIQLAQELDYGEGLVCSLVVLEAALAATGDAEAAATLVGATDAEAERISFVIEPLERRVRDRTVELAEQALGEDAFAAARAAGSQRALDDVAAEALVSTTAFRSAGG